MVTHFTIKIINTGLPMAGYLFDTIIVALLDRIQRKLSSMICHSITVDKETVVSLLTCFQT